MDPLAAQFIDELTQAWDSGEPITVEQILARHREVTVNSEVAVPLIYEELCRREENGETVEREELLRRFPEWRSHLEKLFDCHQLLGSARGFDFPKPGDCFGEFRLVKELGRGAEGRVFLATQPALSDRPVVLKVTPSDGREHLSLARLHHSSIVPVYFIQEFPERGLLAICMPYLGGRTMAQLLESLRWRAPKERSGEDIAALLDNVGTPAEWETAEPRGPARQFLAHASFNQAVCWIGACLADALHYAHQRGLLHLDIKPSNVLLANDGQPMLLDFHLAREARDLASDRIHWIGGTPGYMSPEQESLLESIREGRAARSVVDHRTDIFALGVLLYELLLGHVPANPAKVDHGWLPRNVTNVLDRCVQRDARSRFPNAELLANALRQCLIAPKRITVTNRWVTGLPARRAIRGSIGVVVGALILFTVFAFMSRVQQASIDSLKADEHVQRHEYTAAERALRHGLSQISLLPATDELRQKLRQQLAETTLEKAAQQLHLVVEHLRFLDGPNTGLHEQPGAIDTRCERIWRQRELLLNSAVPTFDSRLEEQVRIDFLDLAMLWTDLRVRLTPADRMDEVQHAGVLVLVQAGRQFGLSPALCHEVQRHAEQCGMHRLAEEYAARFASLVPKTAWEHYSLGRAYLQDSALQQAAAEFQIAVDLAPDDFWINFYTGVTAFRLRRFEDALTAFGACVATRPTRAECFYNRGVTNEALGRMDRAEQDFQRAKALEASPLPAH